MYFDIEEIAGRYGNFNDVTVEVISKCTDLIMILSEILSEEDWAYSNDEVSNKLICQIAELEIALKILMYNECIPERNISFAADDILRPIRYEIDQERKKREKTK